MSRAAEGKVPMAQIRILDAVNDHEAWNRLLSQAMEGGEELDWSVAEKKKYTGFGMFEGEHLVAAMNLQKFERFFSGQRVSVHDPAGVGWLPLARGKGYMDALI